MQKKLVLEWCFITMVALRESFHWAIADIELRGMMRGIQMLQTHCSRQIHRSHLRALDGEYTKAVILCDCRSAISRIYNAVHCTIPLDTLVKGILSAVEDLVEDVGCGIDHVVVQWIPGHLTAIPGNGVADQESLKGADFLCSRKDFLSSLSCGQENA